MTWKDWLPRKSKAREPAPALPPPRLVESQGQAPMLLPMGGHIVEILSVLHPDERWLDGVKALDRIPLSRCASKEHADAFTSAHWERLWPSFIGRNEVRLHFLGEPPREDNWGFCWIPCVRMTEKGFVPGTTWIVNPRLRENNVFTQNDLVVVRLA